MTSPYTLIANLLNQVPDIPDDSIVSRTIYHDDYMRTILFAFAAGQELSEHTSSQAATLHFLQGQANVTLGEDITTAQAGTWVHMSPGLPHSIAAQTPVLMLLTMYKTNSPIK